MFFPWLYVYLKETIQFSVIFLFMLLIAIFPNAPIEVIYYVFWYIIL